MLLGIAKNIHYFLFQIRNVCKEDPSNLPKVPDVFRSRSDLTNLSQAQAANKEDIGTATGSRHPWKAKQKQRRIINSLDLEDDLDVDNPCSPSAVSTPTGVTTQTLPFAEIQQDSSDVVFIQVEEITGLEGQDYEILASGDDASVFSRPSSSRSSSTSNWSSSTTPSVLSYNSSVSSSSFAEGEESILAEDTGWENNLLRKKCAKTKTKPRQRQQNLRSFVDSVTDEDIAKFQSLLSTFFYGCNIPFNVVESDHFKNLMSFLRPSLQQYIPSRKHLAGKLLDDAYEEISKETKKIAMEDSVLIVDGWKNSSANKKTVTTMIHNSSGPHFFLDSWDISHQSETGNEVSKVVDESIKLAKEIYNTNVYAAVSDNASVMMKMGRTIPIWHSTCSSHTANLLAKQVVDKSLTKKLNTIIHEFKLVDLETALLENGGKRMVIPIDVRWCSYEDAYKTFLENLPALRAVCWSDKGKKVKMEVKSLIIDDDFAEEICKFAKLFAPICKLIDLCQKHTTSIADAVNLWLDLEVPTEFPDVIGDIEARRKMALNIYAMAAYMLHPSYFDLCSIRLSEEQKRAVQNFLIEELDGPGLEDLMHYQKKSGFFQQLFSKQFNNPLAFWNAARVHHPSLSSLAVRLLQIPASSATIERLFSQWSFVHNKVRNRLSFETSKKLIHVYYNLKLKDGNLSTDY